MNKMANDNKFTNKRELLDALQGDEDILHANRIDAIYIPPPVSIVTDEEDIEEDSLNDMELMNNSESVVEIIGTFEIHIHGRQEDKFNSNRNNVNESDNRKIIWKKINPIYKKSPMINNISKVEEIKNRICGMSPSEVFSLYFDDVISKIVQFTNKYARDNHNSFHTSDVYLKRFIGILILSGYRSLPAINLYWSNDADLRVPVVQKCMSYKIFRNIRKYLHLSDNDELNPNDKFAKLRPIFNMVNEKNMQFGIFDDNICINEQMVPYIGRHSHRSVIKRRCTWFGFKLWCLCSSEGYLYKFVPYEGKNATHENNNFELGEQVVLDLLSVVKDPSQHCIYFNEFFSSYNLFTILTSKGYFATGTVHESRIPNCPLEQNEQFKKREKCTVDNVFDSTNQIVVAKCNSVSSVITIVSNFDTVKLVEHGKRFDVNEKKSVPNIQPKLYVEYQKHVNGVDLHNNDATSYKILVRNKKWWWPLFTNMIDSVVVNAWKVYRLSNKEISQSDFRSNLSLSLIKSQIEFEP